MHACRRCARARLGGPAAILLAAVATGAWASAASAYNFQCRFIERVGITDTVLGPTVTYDPGTSHRIRIQFGVFDDAQGPAPAGGFIAWNQGTLSTTSGVNTRTPGCLAPYRFAPNQNGQPPQDPFTSLTAIDAAWLLQHVPWECTDEGEIPPMPPAMALGLNTFVSVFEFTTLVNGPNHIVAGGNNVPALWLLGSFQEPDCGDPADPNDDVPGFVEYRGGSDGPGRLFTRTLDILIPAPGAAWCVGLVGLMAGWRRRR